MARAIIRYSFAGSEKQRRTAVRDGLRAAGFDEIGTALYERTGPAQELTAALMDVLALVGTTNDGFDHLWLYMDGASEHSHGGSDGFCSQATRMT